MFGFIIPTNIVFYLICCDRLTQSNIYLRRIMKNILFHYFLQVKIPKYDSAIRGEDFFSAREFGDLSRF